MKKHEQTAAGPDDGMSAAGQTGGDRFLQSRDDIRTTAVEIARQANHNLLLHTMNLEAAIFDQRPFLDAVTRFVLNHHEARFLILVQDGRKAIQQSNRLIELARRMSSQIQFRRPAPQHRDFQKTILLNDRAGYLLCPPPGRFECSASINNPGMARDLGKYFMEVWEHAEADVETRRLDL
ncbi:MAG: hypothetical protein WBN57_08215 [Gammaproteobacteria bacterium]